MNDRFMDPQASFEDVLESLEMTEDATPEELLEDFILGTDLLAASERLQVLGEALEAAAEGRSRRASGSQSRQSQSNSFQDFARGLQAFTQIAQAAAPIVGGMATAFGGNSQTARDVARISGYVGQGASVLGNLTGQVTSPRPAGGSPAGGGPPRPAPVVAPQQPIAGVPLQAQVSAPGQLNPAALAQLMLSDPRFSNMMRQFALTGRGEVALNVESTDGLTRIHLPAPAVLDAASALLADAAEEMPAVEGYMVGENGTMLIDPTDRGARAALVVDYFRRAWDAERQGLTEGLTDPDGDEAAELEVEASDNGENDGCC